MATICTTDFAVAEDFELDITDPEIGFAGWSLVLMGAGDELRVTLTDEQMQLLSDKLAEFGYTPSGQAEQERAEKDGGDHVDHR